jgi:hypothetical protein
MPGLPQSGFVSARLPGGDVHVRLSAVVPIQLRAPAGAIRKCPEQNLDQIVLDSGCSVAPALSLGARRWLPEFVT